MATAPGHSTMGAMTLWMIEYTYDDNTAGRDQHRPAHRAYLEDLREAGDMVAFGRFEDDGVPGALLIAHAATRDSVEALIAEDPFVTQGLVATYRIRQWGGTWEPPANY